MADYLVVTGDNPNFVHVVKDKKSLAEVIESLGLAPGEPATVYRVASARKVKVVEETQRRIVETDAD